GQPLCALGEAALGRHDPAKAHAIFERALKIAEHSYGTTDLSVLTPLDGLGRSALAEKRPRDAVTPLERAADLMKVIPTLPDRRARVAFALAQALWDAHGDRGRARTVATRARADYETAGERFTTERDEVDVWLAAHR